MHPLLRQALILDTETTGLARGSGIHELAVYSMADRRLVEYLLDPNLVAVQAGVQQDELRLASSVADTHRRVPVSSWRQAIIEQFRLETGRTLTPNELDETLRVERPFLARALAQHAHLRGETETLEATQARLAVLRAAGVVSAQLGVRTTMDELLTQHLPHHLKQSRILWIANASFEAKQLGAQVAAAINAGVAADLKAGLETANTTADPFYVTGARVNAARTAAQLTGDWRPVWEAYNLPHEGLAVRDVLDVTKASYSYARKLGLYSGPDAGLSIDTQTRIWNAVSGGFGRELHRAGEDVALHEGPLLDRLLNMTDALMEADKRSPEGLRLLKLARQKQGALADAAKYFSILTANLPEITRKGAGQRLARAARDIESEGFSVQTRGIVDVISEEQMTPSGVAQVRRSVHGRIQESWDQVVARVRADYGGIADELASELTGMPANATHVWEAGLDWVLKPGTPRGFRTQVPVKAGLVGLAAAGAGLLAAGTLWGRRPAQPGNLVSYNYEQWVAAQEGMSPQGLAKERRHRFTDFGSPYRGPVVSNQVFVQQDLLEERERWLRGQYGARHFDPQSGLFGLEGVFKFRQGGYSYLAGGSPVAGIEGLRGNNLLAINLSDGGWRVRAEDADTITVKRGGVRGAVASFFGLNRGYSFRLAGIDSTEVAHGANAAQPGAEAAAQGFRSLLRGNLQLVWDPSQTTYGRSVGVVFADGRNLNVEAIRRGYAAHLPYGRADEALLDYSALARVEEAAAQAGRGMWSNPWAQAYREASTVAGERITFNTFARRSKLVESASATSLLAHMEATQRNGAFTERDSQIAREIGSLLRPGADSVGPTFFEAPARASKTYLTEQLRDVATFTTTHGTGYNRNKFSRRSGYGTLDKTFVLDTMGTSNNPWTQTRFEAYELYETQKAINQQRKLRMAEQQRAINSVMFESGIGHHRM